MKHNELIEALENYQMLSNELEDELIANDGEMTDQAQAIDAAASAVQALIENEGVDDLGRWVKSVEDKKKALKAEKDYITREMAACDNTLDYIKARAGQVLRVLGKDKVKGANGYSFAQYTSRTVKADAATLKERYGKAALDAIHAAGIPECVTVTLGASSTLVPEGVELPDFFIVKEEETSKFGKPRASKEE